MRRDCIDCSRDFLPQTASAWRKWRDDDPDRGELFPNILFPERAAHFYWVLRMHPDTPEMFPAGKWATVQRLEVILEEMFTPTSEQS